MTYFVCFHAGCAIGTYGTMRAAVLAGEAEALSEHRRVNVYPVDENGRKGVRVARITPQQFPSGWIAGIAYGDAA